METAAAVEIEQGRLRQYSLDDFHRCLEKPAGFSHSFHRPGGGQPTKPTKPTNNKTGQITCYKNRTFLLAPDMCLARSNGPWRNLVQCLL
jgi:hypothetical protein